MQITWQEIIDRAKVYADDDHEDEDGWIDPAMWLKLAQVEYRQLRRRWIRSGLVQPTIVTDYLEGATTEISGVLAVVGVGQDLGSSVRFLNYARPPFWRGSGEAARRPSCWSASGFGDVLTIELNREPSDLAYTTPEPGVEAALDFPSFGFSVLDGLTDGALRMKTAGVDGNSIGIRFIPDATGDSYWTEHDTEYRYHFDHTVPATTEDFEASIEADDSLPFEVSRASTVNANWSDWDDIQNLTLTALPFSGGVDPVIETGNYLIKYIPTAVTTNDPLDTVELPEGGDERLVLGLAKRAHVKDSLRSSVIEDLIRDANADIAFHAASKQGGIVVKATRRRTPFSHHSTPYQISWPDRGQWVYV